MRSATRITHASFETSKACVFAEKDEFHINTSEEVGRGDEHVEWPVAWSLLDEGWW